MDLQILQMLIPTTLKWNIAHVWDMLTDLICKIYRPEKMTEKIDWKLKLTSPNMPLLNNLQYKHCIYI